MPHKPIPSPRPVVFPVVLTGLESLRMRMLFWRREGCLGANGLHTDHYGGQNLADTENTQQNRLIPGHEELQKALKLLAEQAQSMAAAFGETLPNAITKAVKH